MNFLPKAAGSRPRVACEILPRGVVAARSADAGGPMDAVSRAELQPGAVSPGLKPGNIVDRVAVTAAVKRALEAIGSRPNARGADITLVIPDGAARVLLLDFDALSNKLSEALPIVRFRLKKLLPFDSDDAMVSFQIMSTSRTVVRVLAVAIPRDVLREYETAVREAGFEPGAVLPSTLAGLAGLQTEDATLLVNASTAGVTTAIARNGILLLHRSIDLQTEPHGVPANLPPALFETAAGTLPLIDVEDSASEWAAQQPLPEHGRNPYADTVGDEEAVQGEDSITGLPTPAVYAERPPMLPLLGNEGVFVPTEEIAQAVSVAAAYFEDTLAVAPDRVLSAGPIGAEQLSLLLQQAGVFATDGLRVREFVEAGALQADAVTSAVPRAWLAGVAGALRG